MREECEKPSHYLKGRTIHQYLEENNIPGICGIDTRALTRKLRNHGVMMGYLTTTKTPGQALEALGQLPDYGSTDFVKDITTPEPYQWGLPCKACSFKEKCTEREQEVPLLCGVKSIDRKTPDFKIVAFDCGLKYNILRQLYCEVVQ